MKPIANSPAIVSACTTFAPTTLRDLKMSSRTSGWAAVASRHTNPAPSATATASRPSVRSDPKPYVSEPTSAYTASITDDVINTAPGTSALLSASELRTRGYYLGSNVSYNVKKLVELGYLHHARSRIDRRSVRISLTEKGTEVHDIVKGVYDKHVRTVEQIGGIAADDFERMNNALLRLERFWTDQIRYKL